MIISGREIPPYRPGKDINMFSQSEIGAFDEKLTKGIELTDADQQAYKEWDFVSKRDFLAEIVEFLRYEEVSVLYHLPISIFSIKSVFIYLFGFLGTNIAYELWKRLLQYLLESQ